MAKFVPDDVPAWKIELTEKLAASRAKRSGRGTTQPRLPLEHPSADAEPARASVLAAVAARYAARPSYREVLEREAEEAALAAEKALIEAQAAQEAVRRRLEDARLAEAAAAEAREAEEILEAEQQRMDREAIEVRYDVDERTRRQMQAYEARRSAQPRSSHQPAPPQIPELSDPLEEETVAPAIPLAANLIEFPRELVATRKARPRLAEGPLRDAEPQQGQLRIFEVEPDSIDHRPGAAANAGLDWSAIRLDNPKPEPPPRRRTQAAAEMPAIKPASLEDRIMAALVDAALSFAGFLVFVFVFNSCTAHPPSGRTAIIAASLAVLTTFIAYQWLFFRFGESTPGMMYARIALCTMDDDNPTRTARQRRVGALLLSALPLGLGLLWAMFDEDQLGWHDRISGTYQRSYK